MKKAIEIKELKEFIEDMLNGTELERKAAATISEMDVQEDDFGVLTYTVIGDEPVLNFNKKAFEEIPDDMKRIFVQYIYYSMKEGHNKRAAGVETLLWNLATTLEFSSANKIEIEDGYTPEVFGFEEGLSAEEYVDLLIEYRAQKLPEIEIEETAPFHKISEKAAKKIEELVVI